MTRVLVCCGTGGAGKTTVAAALGLAHALAGQRVVVLTIDPARRLADALGLARLGNEPTPIALTGLGGAPGGSLHALMLDRKATFDAVVRRFAPDEATAERLIENRYYHAVSTRLAGSQEYMATERLYALVQDGRWDVVVLDTPPTQHALDFFVAPDRVRHLLSQRALAALLRPGSGLVELATRRAAALVRRVAGETVIADLQEFFQLFTGLSEGFRARGQEVGALLRGDQTRYFLVASAAATDHDEILDFLDLLRREGMRFAGFLLNRVLEPVDPWVDGVDVRAPEPVDPAAWRAAVHALHEAHRAYTARVERDEAAARRLFQASHGAAVHRLPEWIGDLRTLQALATFARHLPVTEPVSPSR